MSPCLISLLDGSIDAQIAESLEFVTRELDLDNCILFEKDTGEDSEDISKAHREKKHIDLAVSDEVHNTGSTELARSTSISISSA